MLIGQYSTRFSSKKRVAIPKKFRQELGQRVILAKWYEKCLVLISESQWQALLNRLTGRSKIITSPVRDTDRFILGSAFELEPDGQGRVVIPEPLSNYAGLKEEVVFLGLGDRVELWDRVEWGKRESYLAEQASGLVEELAQGIEK